MSRKPPKQPVFTPGRSGAGPTVGLPAAARAARPFMPPGPARIAALMKEAVARYQANDLTAATDLVRQILLAAPETADALHLGGLIALKRGALGDAEASIRKAIRHAPGQGTMWVSLGNALRRRGKVGDALGAYNRSIELDPRFPGGYLNRGLLYQERNQPEEALADFRTVMQLAANLPDGYGHAARLLLNSRRVEEALTVNLQALHHMPENGVFLSGAADALEKLSRLDDALFYAERARAALPGNPMAIKIWATIKRRQGDLEVAKAALEKLDIGALPPGTARLVHAELAQIHERMGETDKAFAEFSAQNAIALEVLENSPIDAQGYLDRVEGLRVAFTEAFVASWAHVDGPDDKPDDGQLARRPPVFLVGFPRSGTTLLDQMLDAHPDVQVFEEFPVLLPVRDAVAARPGGYPHALADLDAAAIADLRQLYWRGLETLGGDLDRKLIVNKLPLNIIHAGLIHRVFPEARFILALRHPADAVLSCFMQDFQLNPSMANTLTVSDTARLYDRVMGLWQAYEEVLPLTVHRVKYEELIADREVALRAALDFLALDWDDAVLDHVAHAKRRKSIMTPSYTEVTQPITTRPVGRWHRYAAYLEPVMPVLAPHTAYFGYME